MEQFTNNQILTDFLMISTWQTVLALVLSVLFIYAMYLFKKKKVSFANRMLISTGLGFLLGLIILATLGMPKNTEEIIAATEISSWFSNIGGIFTSLLKFMAVPMVFVALTKVIIDHGNENKTAKIAFVGVSALIIMTTIAAIIGAATAMITNAGAGMSVSSDIVASNMDVVATKQENMAGLAGLINSFVPSDFASIFTTAGIVGVVIFAILCGVAANKMKDRNENTIYFIKGIYGLHAIVVSIVMNIIKFMPYATILLIANALVANGTNAFYEAGLLIGTIYIALILMFIVHIIINMVIGRVNPIKYIKNATPVLTSAFASRSSMAMLPMTIETGVNEFKNSEATSSFVGTISTQLGMSGCSGVYPAVMAIALANMLGINIDPVFIFTLVIAVVIGSIGLPGMPGTATTALVVTLSILGVSAEAIAVAIAMSVSIEAFVDMGRTALNVSGGLTAINVTGRILKEKI